MSTWKCLIADDEPIAREIIQTYCGHLPYLEVVASVANAIEAKTVLTEGNIDILFLDINMPVMSGISFLKTLKNPPQVIFTTAYREYAVDAFDLSAVDYLLKPFSLERFIVAVDKALEKLQSKPMGAIEQNVAAAEQSLFIRTDGKIFKINVDELLYAEASGNYTKFVLTHSVLMPAMTFSNTADLLPKNLFVRVHRSFVINKHKISHIEGNRVFINKTEIPIGSNYKDAFLKELGI